MEEAGFRETTISFKPPEKRRSKRPLIIIAAVIVVAVIIFLAIRFIGSSKKTPEKSTSGITPTPTEFQFPTDTPTPSGSEKSTPTPTSKEKAPTPTSAANPVDKKTGLDRSELKVAVQNGSGTVGVASKVSDYLKGFGYHVVAVGNAETFDYENVTISIKTSSVKYLPLLKSDISKDYTIAKTSEDLDASSSADVVVIVGK
ncbi:MAG: LytR C-terminal domain-containing protein [Patescibacteria group bacterium]|nr:LytR C-terminal domain-containing protein [Patescibacteria group bacterium]